MSNLLLLSNNDRVKVSNEFDIVEAYITNSGFTTAALITAIRTYLRALITNGIWSIIGAEYIFTTDSLGTNAQKLDQMKFNVKNPANTNAANRLIFTNNPTGQSEGLQFNGVNQSANSFFQLAALYQNTNFQAVYVNTNNVPANWITGGFQTSGGAGHYIAERYSSTFNDYMNCNSNTVTQGTNTNAQGLYLTKRLISTEYKTYKNGILQRTETAASVNVFGFNYYIGCRNDNSTLLYFTGQRLNGYCLGIGALSDPQQIIYQNLNNQLQLDIENALLLVAGSRKTF